MNARVEAVMEMAKTWPTEDQAELLDALFGLVSPAGGELEAQWTTECEDRCAAIDSGEMPLIAADLVMAKYRRSFALKPGPFHMPRESAMPEVRERVVRLYGTNRSFRFMV